MSQPEIVIAGAGAIGLSIGWKLAASGCAVTVLERDEAGDGATKAAGGMLAAAAEIGFEELELYRFSRRSLKMWPQFARDLEAVSGVRIDYRDEGTLIVADDRDSAEVLRRVFRFQQEHDVPVEWLTGREALEIEPFLSPKLSAGVFSPEDHQVDNRLLVDALKEALLKQGGTLHERARVAAIEPSEERPAAVTDDGTRFDGDVVIMAAGCWSREIDGLPREILPPVRPVKGQMVELKMALPFDLRHVIRGPHAYLCPKSDGHLLIGATSEEMGFDTTVTAGGLYSLLEGAWEIVPGIYELELSDTWAGLRPASRDHAPVIGWSAAPGVFYATGHYRHGILQTPVTAELVVEAIRSGSMPEMLAPYDPRRFAMRAA